MVEIKEKELLVTPFNIYPLNRRDIRVLRGVEIPGLRPCPLLLGGRGKAPTGGRGGVFKTKVSFFEKRDCKLLRRFVF